MQHIRFWLVLCSADAFAGSYPLNRDQHLIGRSQKCDICLLHPSVSRQHAILTFNEPELLVHDSGSTNGTFVDGNLVTDTEITIGTLIHFGRVAAEVWDEQPDPTELADDQIETDRCSKLDDSTIMLRVQSFSAVQKRVLELLLQGLSEKQVVTAMHVNQHTLHRQIRRIYARLDVHSRAELMARFTRMGFDPQTLV